ncbi:MAG: exodeoxyribonuclease V subunit gamma [Puniceicoccales bacterium]|jgi:exodeoxyribonuclease V gamma subunit|nr:exodeoxyribonuclease V subunit gamma [Puniceicoccales bacterium]
MPFFLHHGNDLARLAQTLAAQLAAPADPTAPPDPFRKETIVVPDRDLARWLQLQIASSAAICPPINFLFPGRFLYDHIFNPMLAASAAASTTTAAPSETDPFAPAAVTWQLMRLLADFEDTPVFERAKNYVGGDPVRRHQLAQKLAALFDRYMTYRPEWLEVWEGRRNPAPQHPPPPDTPDTAWQAALWRALIASHPGETRHFSGLFARFMRETANATAYSPPPFLQKLTRLRRVFYFGISSLPPAHLDILCRIADCGAADIRFFAINPCADFWDNAKTPKARLRGGDTSAAYHPLLDSLGKPGSDFFRLWLDRNITDSGDAFFDFADDAPPSILDVIRRGVQENTPPPPRDLRQPPTTVGEASASAASKPPPPPYRSLLVHNCHSPLREIEVLRDQLLAAFAADPTLQPDDIRVCAPDLAEYTPHIAAVFGELGTEGAIPWVLAGKSPASEFPECKAFLALLATGTGRFKASEILALLRHNSVRLRFQISAREFDDLSRRLKQANLAWGIDAAFREAAGSGATYQNSWRFALDRLLLGAAMTDPTDADTDAPDTRCPHPLPLAPTAATAGKNPFIAYDVADARPSLFALPIGAIAPPACLPCEILPADAPAVGKLADFAEKLFTFRAFCDAPARPCAEWLEHLSDAVEQFFDDDGASPGITALHDALDRFRANIAAAACADLTVPFTVAAATLREILDAPSANNRAAAGRVVFTGFGSIRNAPVKIAAFLGMGDGQFPHNAPPQNFDLLAAATPRAGDRNARDEDRYAFLTALMATGVSLHIFHSGQSLRDNKESPPSSIVRELLDTADKFFAPPEGFTKLSAALVLKHPLHPFSPDYFKTNKDPRLAAFDPTSFAVAKRLTAPPTAAATPTPAPPTAPSSARASASVASKPTPAAASTSSTSSTPSTPSTVHSPPPPSPYPVAAEAEAFTPSPLPIPVSLEDLIRFLISPAKEYYTQTLGVRFGAGESDLPDDDGPLAPNHLEKYKLREAILSALVALPELTSASTAATPTTLALALDIALSTAAARLHAEGVLPPDASVTFREVADGAQALMEAFCALKTGPRRPPFRCDIPLEGGVLRARFTNIFENVGQVFLHPGAKTAKSIIRAGLTHLAYCAADLAGGAPLYSHGIYKNKEKKNVSKTSQTTWQPISPADAKSFLSALLVRRNAVAAGFPPPCFDPETASALLVETRRLEEKGEFRIANICQAWEGARDFSGADAYAKHRFGEELPENVLFSQLETLTHDFFHPLLPD